MGRACGNQRAGLYLRHTSLLTDLLTDVFVGAPSTHVTERRENI
jgi:hypothetical protein